MMLMRQISTATNAAASDIRGVLRQSLCEAVGGFAAKRFSSRDGAKALLIQIDEGQTEFSKEDIDLLMSSLTFSLHELGVKEFQTITGYDFEFGVTTLAELRKVAKEQS